MGEPDEKHEPIKCGPVESLLPELRGSSLCEKEIRVDGIGIRIGYIAVPEVTPETLRALAALRLVHGLDILLVKSSRMRVDPEQASVLGIKLAAGRGAEAPGESPVRSLVVRPLIDADLARKIFESKVKSQIAGFMGALSGRKVEFLGMELAYLPLRCYRVLYNRRFAGREDLAIQEMEYCFELATGSMVVLDGEELSVYYEFSQLGELDETVVAAYEFIGEKGEASLDELAEVLGSTERAEIVVRMLIDYGLIEPVGMNNYIPQGPGESSDVTAYFLRKGLAVEGEPPSCSRVLGPGIEVSILDRIVGVWGVVKERINLYFPVYIGVFKKRKGPEGLEIATIIDGVWGKRLEDIEELVASSKVLYIIDEIINDIVSRRERRCGESTPPAGAGEGGGQSG